MAVRARRLGSNNRQGDPGPPRHLQATLAVPASHLARAPALPRGAPPLPTLPKCSRDSGRRSTYSMGNQSPHRCFTVSMSSWQRRRRLTSLRALDGTTSVIHTCREGGGVRRAAAPRHQPTEPGTVTARYFLLLFSCSPVRQARQGS